MSGNYTRESGAMYTRKSYNIGDAVKVKSSGLSGTIVDVAANAVTVRYNTGHGIRIDDGGGVSVPSNRFMFYTRSSNRFARKTDPVKLV